MKVVKNIFIIIVFFVFLSSFSQSKKHLIDKDATEETINLFNDLKELSKAYSRIF